MYFESVIELTFLIINFIEGINSENPIVKCESCVSQYCLIHSKAHPIDVSCAEYEKKLKKLNKVVV